MSDKLLVSGKAATEAGDQRRRRPTRRAAVIWRAVAQWRRHVSFVALGLVLGVTIAGAGPALSEPPSASDVVTVTSFGSTLTIQRPGSAAEGDVLVASVAARLSGSDVDNSAERLEPDQARQQRAPVRVADPGAVLQGRRSRGALELHLDTDFRRVRGRGDSRHQGGRCIRASRLA